MWAGDRGCGRRGCRRNRWAATQARGWLAMMAGSGEASGIERSRSSELFRKAALNMLKPAGVG